MDGGFWRFLAVLAPDFRRAPGNSWDKRSRRRGGVPRLALRDAGSPRRCDPTDFVFVDEEIMIGGAEAAGGAGGLGRARLGIVVSITLSYNIRIPISGARKKLYYF